MTINRTTLLDLPLPVTGTEPNTWGDVVNYGLTEYLDISIAGSLELSTDADVLLASTEGTAIADNIGATTAQYAVLRCTGSRTVTRNITAPAWAISSGTLTDYSKTYIVVNETTGGQNIVLRATNSVTPTYTTGVTIVPGERAVCVWNGSDFVKAGGVTGGSNTQVQYNNAGVLGGIANATSDGTTLSMTSPKVITGINDTNGNELLKVTATGSAVNELTLANAATGNAPTLSATGDDTNIGINITPKGSGVVTISNLAVTTIDATNIEVTNIKAKDGTAAATIADSTGVVTVTAAPVMTALTASQAVFTTAGKALTSNAITGTGNVVMSASPTLTGTIAGASLQLSSLTSGRVTYATTSGLLTDSANLLYSGTDLTVYGIRVGRGAGAVSTNTAVGASALAANTSGSSVTGVGYQALTANTSGNNSVAFGVQALRVNTTGNDNSAFGTGALYSSTTGSANTALGKDALVSNTTASNNTAVGFQAGYSNTTGASNIALGTGALYSNVSSNNNVAIGVNAAYSAASSVYGGQVAIGLEALYNCTSPYYAVAVGFRAGKAYTSSGATENSGSVFIGGSAGIVTTTGINNSFVGGLSGYQNTTGSQNTAVGGYSLFNNTTASNNTAVGYQAGYNVTTGIENTFLGTGAGSGVNPGYAVCLGRASGAGLAGNYTLYIANDNVGAGNAACWIYGNSSGACYQGNNSSSWSTTSDARLKNVLGDSTKGLAEIMQVEVKNFRYKSKDELPDFVYNEQGNAVVAPDSENIYTGPIAQQVQTPFPESVKTGEMGVLTVDSDPIFWAMLNAIKELKVELDSVKAELATLKGN